MPRAKKRVQLPPTLQGDAVSAPDGPFKALGLQGFDALAPVLIAALATEEPLLLIGPHGTAKSLLLTQIGAALGLVTRHYNASLLNFDDLVGFPLPGKNGELEYVKTPAAIWGAGAVIFDELSRCRPDIQNKLFPIIHERKVQGLPLEGLRYRWAAMNPPTVDDDSDQEYLGSEPLDTALADRFAFVVPMPSWASLSEDEQIAVIQATDGPPDPAASTELVKIVARTRAALQSIIAEGVASYVRTLVALLAQAKITLSPRRAGMIYRSVLAVHAAAIAINPSASPSNSALLAVRNCLPQRAQGIVVKDVALLSAHKQAWRFVGIKAGDPLKAILCAAEPIERLRLAVAAPSIGKGEFSRIIADSLAQLPPGAREAATVHLFETGAVGRLNAAVAAQAAELYRDVATPANFSETLHASNTRFKTWATVKNLLSRLDPAEPRAHLHANTLAAAFARNELSTPLDAEKAFEAFASAQTHLGGSPHA